MDGLMEAIGKVLTSELFLEALAAVVAAVWALPRLSAWRDRVRETRHWRLLDLARDACAETYVAYVQAIKAANADGKLQPEEAGQAREMALRILRDKAARELPGVLKDYGRLAFEALIERGLARLKREGVQ